MQQNKLTEVISMAAPGLYLKVLSLIGEEKRGYVLDAPAGTGELSRCLKERNFGVLAADINQVAFKGTDIEFKRVDLNKEFPFNDFSFDHAICVEGIEHLENPYHIISEFSRVIKKGGALVLTTPNILNIFSRLRYLLTGYYEYFGGYYASKENFYVFHINPVGFPELEYILGKSGFEIERIATNRSNLFKKSPVLVMSILFLLPLINIVTRLKVKDRRMRELFLSKEILMGELLILKCRKKI